MRLLVTLATCIVVVNGMASYYDVGLNGGSLGMRGMGRDLGGGRYGQGYDYGAREGGRRGFGSSGYANSGRYMGQGYSHRRNDYKAIVEKHNSGEQGGSQYGSYNNRGGMSNGFGSSGRSEYARGYYGRGLGI